MSARGTTWPTWQSSCTRQGRPLRIATKYSALIRRFCYANGINFFRLIDSQGATEAAPGLGYADMVADITETGTTLRDNQLKIVGGPILRSQACLIGSRRSLRGNPGRLAAVKTILELVEARRRGRNYVQVTANIAGASAEDVGRRVASRPELAGMQGPTVAPVYAGTPTGWYTITLFTPQDACYGGRGPPARARRRRDGSGAGTVCLRHAL